MVDDCGASSTRMEKGKNGARLGRFGLGRSFGCFNPAGSYMARRGGYGCLLIMYVSARLRLTQTFNE